MRHSNIPIVPAVLAALVTVAAAASATPAQASPPDCRTHRKPVTDRRPPVVELSGGFNGASGVGLGWQLSARYTYWVTPWLGVGPKLRTGFVGSTDAFWSLDRIDSSSASLGLSLRSAGKHADFILSAFGGAASAKHGYVTKVGGWIFPSTEATGSESYVTPEVGLRAEIAYRSWTHTGLVFAFDARYDAPAPRAIPDYMGITLTGSVGLAFR